ncbi:MAG: peptidase serine carboxypeptidase [Chlamydiales bacterium]|jgi:carboxypeptidase C (cathepsin A)|nr:peptidase serine carboxypeptidase [Chlamydiales bacterium]
MKGCTVTEEFFKDKKNPSREDVAITKHHLTLSGRPLAYIAAAGYLTWDLEGNHNESQSLPFFTAYSKDQESDPATRPIAFIIGSGDQAPLYSHLGGIGPKRISLSDEGTALKPPSWLAHNPHTLLEVSDLVFIDSSSSQIGVISAFIETYLSRYERWSSPKFLLGEGLSGQAAISTLDDLQRRGIFCNGIALLSTPLADTQGLLEPIFYLPSYAASAFYHKKLPKKLLKNVHQTLEEAERFSSLYAAALLQKKCGPLEEPFLQQIKDFTGIDSERLAQMNGQLSPAFFQHHLIGQETLHLKDSRLTYSRLDHHQSSLDGAFKTAYADYLKRELECERPFSSSKTGSKMPCKEQTPPLKDLLENAFLSNPHLKGFLGCGLFDLKAPYFASDLLFHSLSDVLKGRIHSKRYLAGHHLYLSQPTIKQLALHLKDFIRTAIL